MTTEYAADEAARRRQCRLHRGSEGPFCYPCNERESDRRTKVAAEAGIAQATREQWAAHPTQKKAWTLVVNDIGPWLCGSYDCDATTCVVKSAREGS